MLSCGYCQALMHALLLIGEQSTYYNTSSRLVPLLQLIVDSLVAQTRIFMKGNPLTICLRSGPATFCI